MPAERFAAPKADGPDAGDCLESGSCRSAMPNADAIIAHAERIQPAALGGVARQRSAPCLAAMMRATRRLRDGVDHSPVMRARE